ncbi:unnamed protein product [Linum trigynum]|uniref:Uncharacterized protein n=1 Tax=Linum trigynum TaxID=586398 RepID=A0AAV2DV50_9ROSI
MDACSSLRTQILGPGLKLLAVKTQKQFVKLVADFITAPRPGGISGIRPGCQSMLKVSLVVDSWAINPGEIDDSEIEIL